MPAIYATREPCNLARLHRRKLAILSDFRGKYFETAIERMERCEKKVEHGRVKARASVLNVGTVVPSSLVAAATRTARRSVRI